MRKNDEKLRVLRASNRERLSDRQDLPRPATR